jgi:hypothetical protein
MRDSLFGYVGKCFLCALVLGMLSFQANAATVSYILDQTNLDPLLPDGSDYVKVTISDNTAGQVDFTVATFPGAFTPGTNFGIQAFGFNVMDASLLAIDDFLLPDLWSVNIAPPPNVMNGMGSFDVRISDGGQGRGDPIVFSVLGLSLADIDSNFAAHVADFVTSDPNVTSGFFGGGKLAVVPVPAAVWLFGAGLLGLIGVARRKQS